MTATGIGGRPCSCQLWAWRQRHFEHPLAERGYEARLFRQRDEGPRRDEAELRVPPARQRLHPDDVSGRHGELGLVVHGESPAVHGGPKAVLEREAEAGAGAHGRVEDLVGVPASRLGLVHGGVGVLEEGVRVRAVPRRDRHSDTRLDRQLTAADIEGIVEAIEEPFRHVHDEPVFPAAVRDEKGELVAAEPGQGVVLAAGIPWSRLTTDLSRSLPTA